jgi:hypothetical protein
MQRSTSRRISRGIVLLVVGGALAAGCGSARLVNRTQYGGEIALSGDRQKAYEQAQQMMAQHCGPGNFQIVREGEVPVGTDTIARKDTYYGEGGDTTTAGASTRTATEWRVQYQCGQGGPAPGGPAPGGPPPGPAPSPNGPPPNY